MGESARQTLERLGVPIGGDFHALHSDKVMALLEEAKAQKYRQPRDANGSKARYFHDRLQRKARRCVTCGKRKGVHLTGECNGCRTSREMA